MNAHLCLCVHVCAGEMDIKYLDEPNAYSYCTGNLSQLSTLKKNRMIVPCTAGKRMVVLSEEGAVYPCELLNMKMEKV